MAAAEEQDPPGYNEAEVKEFFDKFDGDGSGNINPAEFRQLLDELSPGMEDEEVEGALEELDGDGDGEISYSGQCGIPPPPPRQAAASQTAAPGCRRQTGRRRQPGRQPGRRRLLTPARCHRRVLDVVEDRVRRTGSQQGARRQLRRCQEPGDRRRPRQREAGRQVWPPARRAPR